MFEFGKLYNQTRFIVVIAAFGVLTVASLYGHVVDFHVMDGNDMILEAAVRDKENERAYERCQEPDREVSDRDLERSAEWSRDHIGWS